MAGSEFLTMLEACGEEGKNSAGCFARYPGTLAIGLLKHVEAKNRRFPEAFKAHLGGIQMVYKFIRYIYKIITDIICYCI